MADMYHYEMEEALIGRGYDRDYIYSLDEDALEELAEREDIYIEIND